MSLMRIETGIIKYIILGIILIIGSGFLIYKSIINKSRYSNINNLSQEVSNIEAEINNYCKLVNAKDYRELLPKRRKVQTTYFAARGFSPNEFGKPEYIISLLAHISSWQ